MDTPAIVTQKYIKKWKINSEIVIYPHLEFEGVFDYKKMKDIVEAMKRDLKDSMDIVIFNKNSFKTELNGSWNIVFGIYVKETKPIISSPIDNMIFCTYIIRSDKYFGKSYGSPLENPLSFSSTSINENFCKLEFKTIEKYLIDNYNGKNINAFPI